MDIRYTILGQPGSYSNDDDDLKTVMEGLQAHLQERLRGTGFTNMPSTFPALLYNRYFDTVDEEVEAADLGELETLLKT